MNQKSFAISLIIFFHFLFVPFGSKGWSFQENPLAKAIQLFDKDKFAEAEPLFRKILDERPDDFMVNYFFGACRTENGHYGEEDLYYLIKASKEVNPLNIDYYFAIQYHAKNQFEKALAYYKLYKVVASVNEQEKVNLTLKMEQCSSQINPFKSADSDDIGVEAETPVVGVTVAAEVVSENTKQPDTNELTKQAQALNEPASQSVDETNKTNDEVQTDAALVDSTGQIVESDQPEIEAQETEPQIVQAAVAVVPAGEKIKFSVNDEITYNATSNFKTDEGRNFFQEAGLSEAELKKILIRTEILREKYKTSETRAEKDSIGQLILSLEGESYELKNSVNQMFMQAKNAENGYWANASPEETESFIHELNASQNANSNKTVDVSPPSEIIIPPILIVDEDVKSDTPKAGNSGVNYKIQLGAYSRGIPNTMKPVFSKISVIRKVDNYTDENGVVVYTTGNLTNYEDALAMQKQVKQEGIKDPVIAAYLNGKRITLEQAKELDKQK